MKARFARRALITWRRLWHVAGLRRRLLWPKNAGTIYGAMLTAWSAGGIVGPLLIASIDYKTALYIIAAIMLVSASLPCVAHALARRRGDIVQAVGGS